MDDPNISFGKKHSTLWNISMWASGLAPVVLVIFILAGLGETFDYNRIAGTQYQTSLFGLITQKPIYILDILLQMLRVSSQGVIYYLALKGIALGLDMTIETDLNYRENKVEDGAE